MLLPPPHVASAAPVRDVVLKIPAKILRQKHENDEWNLKQV
jgi:hypothetical protein